MNNNDDVNFEGKVKNVHNGIDRTHTSMCAFLVGCLQLIWEILKDYDLHSKPNTDQFQLSSVDTCNIF